MLVVIFNLDKEFSLIIPLLFVCILINILGHVHTPCILSSFSVAAALSSFVLFALQNAFVTVSIFLLYSKEPERMTCHTYSL